MAETKHTCTVTVLPTAAAQPVVNLKRRGRLPRSVISLATIRRLRLSAPPAKQELFGARKVGDIVMIWQSHGVNSNNGRLGVIERQSDGYGSEVLAWYVRSTGPSFDVRGDPANGQIPGAVFRDAWLVPVDRAAIQALAQRSRT